MLLNRCKAHKYHKPEQQLERSIHIIAPRSQPGKCLTGMLLNHSTSMAERVKMIEPSSSHLPADRGTRLIRHKA